MERYLKELIKIAERKRSLDHQGTWSNGSETYLREIKTEVEEVIEEIPKGRLCYLEDELADILWDYLNILLALEEEQGVDMTSVFRRACKKFEERISGIESGEHWKDVKSRQKVALAEELALKV